MGKELTRSRSSEGTQDKIPEAFAGPSAYRVSSCSKNHIMTIVAFVNQLMQSKDAHGGRSLASPMSKPEPASFGMLRLLKL